MKGNIFKPILFSTEMVKAILEERKTQTRRILSPQPYNVECYGMSDTYPQELIKIPEAKECFTILRHPKAGRYDGIQKSDAPKLWPAKYQIGDVLWVRETFGETLDENGDPMFYYKADHDVWNKYKPSIHMPKEAARLFLKITTVRIERLNEITEKDAMAEGVSYTWFDEERNIKIVSAKSIFLKLWKDLYPKSEKNEFVFVYEFEQIEKPKDF